MKSKRLLSIVLAVMLVLGLAPAMSIPVKAAGNGKAIQMGGGAIAAGDTVYYGSAGNQWRVLSLSGSGGTYSDGTNSVAADSALFLFSEAALFQTAFHDSENNYTKSKLRAELNSRISDYFTAGEESALLFTTKKGEGSIGLGGFNYSDPGLGGDRLFALSANELQDYLGYSGNPGSWQEGLSGQDWWLRSAYDDNSSRAGAVNSFGALTIHYVLEGYVWARPAFNLNLNSVLFTSAAAGGKSPGAGGADALADIGTSAGNEWKVTLKGLAPGFDVSYCPGTYDSGAITVKYSGADGNYISAIVTDSTGQTIKKYGKIASVSGAAGEVTINTAGKMDADAGDKLFVFCEQDNGDNRTDYASELKLITLPPTGHSWKDATCTEPKTCSICGTTEGNANGHSFVYTLSEDEKSITATCSAENCPSGYHENGITVTLKAPEDLTCDGSAKEATISGYQADIPNLEEEPEIEYYKSAGEGSTEPDGNKLSGAPSAAGNYVAKITWGEKTASAAFTITKTAPQINKAPSASAITYGQTLKNSTLSGGEANVPGTFAWKDSTVAPAVSDSGKTEYDVVFTPEDTDKYAAAECKVTVTVNKADAFVTVAPEGKDLAWSGKAQAIVSEGTVEGGTMQSTPTRTPTPAPTKTPSNGSGKTAAKTGDPNSMGTWMALAAISVLGIAAAMFARRRYGKN